MSRRINKIASQAEPADLVSAPPEAAGVGTHICDAWSFCGASRERDPARSSAISASMSSVQRHRVYVIVYTDPALDDEADMDAIATGWELRRQQASSYKPPDCGIFDHVYKD
jgi:hypothetical protein